MKTTQNKNNGHLSKRSYIIAVGVSLATAFILSCSSPNGDLESYLESLESSSSNSLDEPLSSSSLDSSSSSLDESSSSSALQTNTFLTIKNESSLALDSVIWNGVYFGSIVSGATTKKEVQSGSGYIQFYVPSKKLSARINGRFVVEPKSINEFYFINTTVVEERNGDITFVNSAPLIQIEKAQAPQTGKMNVTEISYTSATFNSSTVENGNPLFSEKGFCYSKKLSEVELNCVAVVGEFTKSIYGLDENTQYYVKAYIGNNKHPRQYGDAVSFVTRLKLQTNAPTNITRSSAVLHGIISTGGLAYTERGFCYGTNPVPEKEAENTACKAVSGILPNFSLSVTDLKIDTEYYVRAYAVNSNGIEYGDIASFKTYDVFVDKRDGNTYRIKDIGNGIIWFLEDLAFNSKTKYTWVEAGTVCPAGWHLPNNADWQSLGAVWTANKDDFSKYSTGEWWSATGYRNCSTGDAYTWYMSSGSLSDNSNCVKSNTYGVRCVKD